MIHFLVTALALAGSAKAQLPVGAATAPTLASAAGALTRALAPAPGPSAMNDVANLFATMTAVTASFPDKTTLVLSGVSPVVTYLSTAPMPHAGTWNVSAFTSAEMSTSAGWLGTPDATLEGVLANGTKVAILLGYLDKPVFDNKTNTVTIITRMLPATDGLALVGGVTNAAAFGITSQLAPQLPTGNLTNVALFIDLAMRKAAEPVIKAATKSAVATYNFGLAYDPDVRMNTVDGSDLQVRTNNRQDFRQNIRTNFRQT